MQLGGDWFSRFLDKKRQKCIHEYEEDVIRQSPKWGRWLADVQRPALFHRLCQTAELLMQKTKLPKSL